MGKVLMMVFYLGATPSDPQYIRHQEVEQSECDIVKKFATLKDRLVVKCEPIKDTKSVDKKRDIAG